MNDREQACVDFYVLRDAGETARRTFACRLAEKAYRLKNSVHVVVADRQQARLLDDLLWTFRDGSFVPHELLGETQGDAAAPVTIGLGGEATPPSDLLINLTDRLPDSPQAVPRIAEIVTADEEGRHRSRRLFVDYRTRGHVLRTHKL